ncbi:hypothetical protein A176_000149 [Myxococcus hansupus]|uniref:Uncharacterized protein n=1 Tax=Pseudomyxococcus hansupus TaxID=1297742 RepID=A0A0H4X5U1_9BACT|nr:hypothetical protein A176_000149 [Myxococcus hansupus]
MQSQQLWTQCLALLQGDMQLAHAQQIALEFFRAQETCVLQLT